MSSRLTFALETTFLENCLTLAAQALCCYDFCLTFTREVSLIWGRNCSAASLIFFILRYPALANTLPVILGYISWGCWQIELSCTAIIRLQMAGDVLIMTGSAIFTAMRIYALSNKSKWSFLFMLVLGLVNPGMSLGLFILSTPYLAHLTPDYQTCNISAKLTGDISMMCAWASSVVCDAAALLLTWLSIRRIPCQLEDDNVSAVRMMSAVLMRDTAVYFGFLLIINSLGLGIGLSHSKFVDTVSTWSAVMSSMILGRLILDLQDLREAAREDDTSESSSVSLALTTIVHDVAGPWNSPDDDYYVLEPYNDSSTLTVHQGSYQL